MTDTAPQILHSRQVATIPVASVSNTQIDAQFRMATEIAKANDMLPQSYRNKPGAVLLVQQWAAQHDVDVLTAMQTVSFVQGRPVIDATMQRALAQRAGFDIRVTEATDDHATVEVRRGGETLGSATYTMDQAKAANLANKPNWKANPEDMLVARATTRAVRRHAPAVLIGVYDQDEAEQIDPDPVTVLTPTADADVIDAEIVPDTGASTPGEVADDRSDVDPSGTPTGPAGADSPGITDTADLTALVDAKRVSKADTIREAQNIANALGVEPPSSIAKIANGTPEVLEKVTTWLLSQPDVAGADEEPFVRDAGEWMPGAWGSYPEPNRG